MTEKAPKRVTVATAAAPKKRTGSGVAKRPRTPAKAMAGRHQMRQAKYALGDVVRHRFYPFRGVIFDIDPVFNNTEEWWLAIPEGMRPRKDQPFYHLLAENSDTEYIAYVSEQNLQPDDSGEPLRHPRLSEFFTEDESGRFRVVQMQAH